MLNEYLPKTRHAGQEDQRKPLRDWLCEHNAQVMWSVNVTCLGPVTCFSVNGCLFHVVAYKHVGWGILLPVPNMEIDATLAKLSEACGVTKEES